jgi:two-component system response regulator YesN
MPEYLIQNENHIQSIDNNKLLQRLLDSFSTITKMYVAVTDVNGRKLLASQKEDTEFCRLIKSLPQGLEYCCGSYARAGREAEKWNEPYFFKCHAGLIAWACPIVLDSKHEGNFICGQVLM